MKQGMVVWSQVGLLTLGAIEDRKQIAVFNLF